MQPATGTITYHKNGLPQFGGATLESSQVAKIEKLNGLFNKISADIGAEFGPVNDQTRVAFGEATVGLKEAYWSLYNCIVGKGMAS